MALPLGTRIRPVRQDEHRLIADATELLHTEFADTKPPDVERAVHNGLIIVALAEKQVVGAATAYIAQPEDIERIISRWPEHTIDSLDLTEHTVGVAQALSVLPDWRNQGVGTGLSLARMGWLSSQGATAIIAVARVGTPDGIWQKTRMEAAPSEHPEWCLMTRVLRQPN